MDEKAVAVSEMERTFELPRPQNLSHGALHAELYDGSGPRGEPEIILRITRKMNDEYLGYWLTQEQAAELANVLLKWATYEEDK